MQLPRRKFHPGKPFTFFSTERISTDPAAEWWQLPAGSTGTTVLGWKGRERSQGEGSHCSPSDFTIRVWAIAPIWREVSQYTPRQWLLYLLTMLHLYPQKPPPYVKLKLPSFCHSTGAKKQHSLPHGPSPKSQGLLCPYALTELLQRHSDLTLARPPTA